MTSIIIEAGFAGPTGLSKVLQSLRPIEDSALAFKPDGTELHGLLGVDAGVNEIAQGAISSVQWQSQQPEVWWMEVYGPHKQTIANSPWLLSFEYRDRDWKTKLTELIDNKCVFAVASIEESIEGVENLFRSQDDFPWDHWRLIVVCMNSSDGKQASCIFGPGYERIRVC